VAVIDVSRPLPQLDPLLRPLSENVFVFDDTCNVYLLRQGSEAIAIDFGAGDVLDELAAIGVERLTDIFVTHHHRDQVQGLQRAIQAGIRIWVPQVEQELFTHVGDHWQARPIANNYNNRQDRFSLLENVRVTGTLADYALLESGELALQVIPTPGHTVGSITLLVSIDNRRLAFSGDLIAAPGKVWSLAATQWSYNGAEGVSATIASLLDLKDRRPDQLLPSHGAPMDKPDEAIGLLVDRLEQLLELRREEGAIASLRKRPYEQITPHLLRNRTSHATSFVLVSETGHALLIDFGYDFTRGLAAGTDRASRRPWLYTIETLKRDFGLSAIDAVIPTHYHDDHVAGCNLLRRVERTHVWAAETFADVLEHPTGYDLPCLWYEPIAVDRPLPVGSEIVWNEFRLTLHEQPGHTRYAVAIETVVDGKRVLFTGDQMGHADGLGLNYVHAGGFEVDDYEKSAQLYQTIQPDLLLSGHWQPLTSGLNHLDVLARRGKALHEIQRALLPMEELDLEGHGPVAEIHPYRIEAGAGHPFEVTVDIRNPAPAAQEVTLRLSVPAGWLVQPGEERAFLASGARTSVSFDVIAPAGTTVRRGRIAVDLSVGARRLGQLVEALVDVS
jgi:glyoxylase-like metal-dependent hydrolase (beta-lactamase superfamily II)